MSSLPSHRVLGATALAASLTLLAACGGEQATESAPRSGVLSGVCPATVVIQTDWEPEAEHGGLYRLLGDDHTADVEAKSVRGPLLASGADTGVDVELRIGGAPVGYQTAQPLLYQDKDILLGYGRVSEHLVTQKDTPVVSVFAQLEKSPYAVYWDPATYPAAKTIADLKKDKVKILFGAEATVWQEYLVGAGLVDKAQVDQSDSPKPATFVAEGGKVAETGFITAEPYMYEVETEAWGKPVVGQLIHDTGFPEYFQSVVVREEDVTKEKDCLTKLVPILQQAQVDYITDPAATNELITELVEEYRTSWTYTSGQAEAAVKAQVDLGLVGNGDDATLGNYDLERVQTLIDLIGEYAPDADITGITPDDLVTNEFIDPAIGLKP
ncbi:ABC-type nitrate/sulfonate/bicarbonate transport system substrate-binding protein [Actinocorallia herbida]|uniref:ABC-type nitrate/sulfonate/bicarbonate transport system substrate-binding protein n=1 Tax=Actinocorallia herbida TaxID=58109 RepID=A0A3N1D0K6_9ACTN|nr:hypothetical protein [Actinocorallia herbida]ROO87054.1 ABC-type nitrate/sulfonate/bicarbonate transport system substrate-binding protein [Actinocorallia herbida]